jgi:addiction module RelE/StbE family toxin
MDIKFSKKFTKQYDKLSLQLKDRFDERLEIFKKNKYQTILNNHKLHGEYAGYRSINITANIRAIYRELEKDHVSFVTIGTHTELYK